MAHRRSSCRWRGHGHLNVASCQIQTPREGASASGGDGRIARQSRCLRDCLVPALRFGTTVGSASGVLRARCALVEPGTALRTITPRQTQTPREGASVFGGDGRIRTVDAGFCPHAPLAGECLQPLGHVSNTKIFTSQPDGRIARSSGCIPDDLVPSLSLRDHRRLRLRCPAQTSTGRLLVEPSMQVFARMLPLQGSRRDLSATSADSDSLRPPCRRTCAV